MHRTQAAAVRWGMMVAMGAMMAGVGVAGRSAAAEDEAPSLQNISAGGEHADDVGDYQERWGWVKDYIKQGRATLKARLADLPAVLDQVQALDGKVDAAAKQLDAAHAELTGRMRDLHAQADAKSNRQLGQTLDGDLTYREKKTKDLQTQFATDRTDLADIVAKIKAWQGRQAEFESTADALDQDADKAFEDLKVNEQAPTYEGWANKMQTWVNQGIAKSAGFKEQGDALTDEMAMWQERSSAVERDLGETKDYEGGWRDLLPDWTQEAAGSE